MKLLGWRVSFPRCHNDVLIALTSVKLRLLSREIDCFLSRILLNILFRVFYTVKSLYVFNAGVLLVLGNGYFALEMDSSNCDSFICPSHREHQDCTA
jgi:hypothetical protein